MASARLLSKLVSAAGSVSSGAVKRVNEGDQARGLETVRPLLLLVAESLTVQASPPDEVKREVVKHLEALIDRYGTMRRTLEALSGPRRRHQSIVTEKAHAWAQAMSVGAGGIEATLKRHVSLLTHLTNWLAQRPEWENKLDEYERWLDSPLDGDAGQAGHTTQRPAFAPGTTTLGGELKKVVMPSPAGPQSPMKLEDSGHEDGHSTLSDVDALEMLTDSAEQSQIAGEGSPDMKLIRLTVLHDKHPGEEAADRAFTDEQRAAIERLKKDADPYSRAVGAVASRDFVLADGLLPHLGAKGVDPVLVLTLQGDRHYFESRYDQALAAYRQAKAKRNDVVTRLNIAVTLLRAQKGSLEENFKEALDLLTDTALTLGEGSREWARVRSLLGLAWHHTPTGSRERNISEGIKCFESAAHALSRERDPHWWAETQLHLGSAWLELPTGDRAGNVARAIEHFEQAMQVWTRDHDRHHWATVQNCLGFAWERNPRGAHQDNLQRAIGHYTAALEVRNREKHPAAWARLQNNLGNAYIQLTHGDHKQNIEKAIACQSGALEVWTRENRRVEWAATQNNLGNAFALLPAEGEERQKNLRRAISCYKAALEVRTRAANPNEWAATQNNMGTALLNLTPMKNGANIEEAIKCFQLSLEVRTRESFPIEWAKTQANMGLAWARHPGGDRAENLHEAVACLENALEVFTVEAHPHQHQHVAARLKDVKKLLSETGVGR